MLGLDCINVKYRNALNVQKEKEILEDGETAVEVYHYLLSLGYCPKLKGIIFFKEMIVSIIYKIQHAEKNRNNERNNKTIIYICIEHSVYSSVYIIQ